MSTVFGSETRDGREDIYCIPSYIVWVLISMDALCYSDLLINLLDLQVEKNEIL